MLPIDIDVTIVTRVDMVVVLLIDLLSDAAIDFVAGIGVDVLAGVDTNAVAAAMTDPDFIDRRVSLEKDSLCCCSAARSCWRIAAVDCLRALQA